MPHDEDSGREQALQRAVLAGDEAAWRALYERAFEPLSAYVAWRCAGLADWTDDIVQETWMIAVRRIRTFDPHAGTFLAWLRGIAANVLRNRLRSLNGRAAVALGRLPEPYVEEPPARPLEQREQAERVLRALNALPTDYEDVLRAKYVDGLSVDEIASAAGRSPKAVESLLTRAREAFRQRFSLKTGDADER